MSLILDALKKMEQDKARRQTKSMDLGPAILQERAPASASRWRTPTLLACAVATTAVSMYFFLTYGSDVNREAAVHPSPVAQAAPALPAVEPAAPSPVAHVETTPVPPVQEPSKIAAPPSIAAPPTPATTTVPPDLVVNGIAWQEERSGRRAVVNGNLVAEGDTIAGFRIKQIYPDKVTFTSRGQSLDVMHSAPIN